MSKTALAIGAHPDDVEFMMVGTLILIKQAGYEPHIMTVANGSGGTAEYDRGTIIKLRRAEAEKSASLIGAEYHEGLVDDIEVFYEQRTLSKVADTIRKVKPEILLLPSLEDYMEDHQNTARLGHTAAFCKVVQNLPAALEKVEGDIFVYHALPYGLRDGMRHKIWPESYVDISDEIEIKQDMLACHKTQQNWLGTSQGLNKYLQTMRDMSAEVAQMSGQGWQYAEGWRRRSHLGFSGNDCDKLAEVLGDKIYIDPGYQRGLDAKPWEKIRPVFK